MFNKKKRSSFYQMAKKNGRSGKYGDLPEEKYNYFLRVLGILKDAKIPEQKGVICSNVLKEISKETNIKEIICHQVSSRILDEIIPLSSPELIDPFLEVAKLNLRQFCQDPYGSYVLQTLLTVSLKFIQHNEKDTSSTFEVTDEQKNKFSEFIVEVSKFIYNNLDEFMRNTYSSYVIRTSLQICSGIALPTQLLSSFKAQKKHDIGVVEEVPENFVKIVEDYGQRIMKIPNLSALILSTSATTVFESCIYVLSQLNKSELVEKLCNHIITNGLENLPKKEENCGHPLFAYSSACRLFETMLSVVSGNKQMEIYENFFKDDLQIISSSKSTNFALAKLVKNWKNKETFPTLYSAVFDCLKKDFDEKSSNVTLALVEVCRKLKVMQASCIKDCMTYFGCVVPSTESKFATLVLHYKTLDDYEEIEDKIQAPTSLDGSKMLQEFLHFNKPIRVVKSILDMSTSEVVKFVSDSKGCHAIKDFCESEFVGEASRLKLLEKLEGNLTTLACDKYGSRSLESLFGRLGVKPRTQMCKELIVAKNKLTEHKIGRIIFDRFELQHFRPNEVRDWQQLQEQNLNKKNVLHKMLSDTTKVTKVTSKKSTKKPEISDVVIKNEELEEEEESESGEMEEEAVKSEEMEEESESEEMEKEAIENEGMEEVDEKEIQKESTKGKKKIVKKGLKRKMAENEVEQNGAMNKGKKNKKVSTNLDQKKKNKGKTGNKVGKKKVKKESLSQEESNELENMVLSELENIKKRLKTKH